MRESPELIALVERMHAAQTAGDVDWRLVRRHSSLGVPSADPVGMGLPT